VSRERKRNDRFLGGERDARRAWGEAEHSGAQLFARAAQSMGAEPCERKKRQQPNNNASTRTHATTVTTQYALLGVLGDLGLVVVLGAKQAIVIDTQWSRAMSG